MSRPRTDISATCVAARCAVSSRHCINRGEDAVYDEVGGGWRHQRCTPCTPMPDCANCDGPHMGHIRTWTGLHCSRASESSYAPKTSSS